MAVIGWGKPKIYIKDVDSQTGAWAEMTANVVENSTTLETTKGDKKEAKIEGGANEDVRFNKNTYALSFSVRASKTQPKVITDTDGLVTDNYAIAIQPEDAAVQGILIDKARVSVEDTFSTEEGGVWTYTFDALQPASGAQVKWGVITYTPAQSETPASITCTPVS